MRRGPVALPLVSVRDLRDCRDDLAVTKLSLRTWYQTIWLITKPGSMPPHAP
jgi:hypothetical protein